MTVFSLVHGGQQGAWCFEPLIAELEARGFSAIAVDLPSEDPDAGLDDYAETVRASLDGVAEPVIVAGHSLGGLVLPLVAQLRPVAGLAFVCAALPFPGESLADTIAEEIAAETSPDLLDDRGRSHQTPREQAREVFFPDLPHDLQEWALDRQRAQGERPHREPSPLAAWPDVPVVAVNGTEDRCISVARAHRTTMRLFGALPAEIPDGHFPFLTNPAVIADGLAAFAEGADGPWPVLHPRPEFLAAGDGTAATTERQNRTS
jgi:pimeloyl-ACP methyl ester carboxylesterase